MPYTLNIRGRLLDLSTPRVMGILNATPDSFYAGSRTTAEADIARRAVQIVQEGGDIIDVGAYSTRPGAQAVPEAEEARRLREALAVVRREVPEAVVSVDTFRPDLARRAVDDWGADIINDVGGPAGAAPPALPHTDAEAAPPMFRTVAELGVPYIYMSAAPDVPAMLRQGSAALRLLRQLGAKDVVFDPGFGFGKTLAQNYAVLRDLPQLHLLDCPVLVGLSRKSMIWRLLGGTPDTSLGGTTALHALALDRGAAILRAHDVADAAACVRLYAQLAQPNS